jgi:hypothetical protein
MAILATNKNNSQKKNPPMLLLPYGWKMGTFKINTLIITFSFKERFIKFKIIIIIQLIWLFWGAQIDRSISKMEKSIVLTLTQNWIWTSNPNRWIRKTWFGNLKLHVDRDLELELDLKPQYLASKNLDWDLVWELQGATVDLDFKPWI